MVANFVFFAETQPQLMLTGPIGMGGAPGGNSYPQAGGMPPYQGYSM